MTTVRVRQLIPAAIVVVAMVCLSACGSDESSATTTGTAPATETTPSTAEPAGTTVVTAPRTTPPPIPTVSTTTTTTIPGLISVTVGVDSSPDRIEQVALGTEVTLVIVNPDADDEFHLHGFDLGDGAVVPAGQSASFTFTANEVGSFALESHITDEVYLVLEVS